MAGKPYFAFYPGDWLRDPVSGTSLAAQGLWLRMLLLAHDCTPRGVLQVNGTVMTDAMIARKCGCDVGEFQSLIAELDAVGVVSRTRSGALYSRRMVRDTEQAAEISRKRSQAGSEGAKRRWGDGNAMANAMANAIAKPCSSSSPSEFKNRVSESGGGKPQKPKAPVPSRIVAWLRQNAGRLKLDADDSGVLVHVLACAERAYDVVSAHGGNVDRLFHSLVRDGANGDWSKLSGDQLDRAKIKLRDLRSRADNSGSPAASLANALDAKGTDRE